jgi:hypothetical protein
MLSDPRNVPLGLKMRRRFVDIFSGRIGRLAV